MTATKGVLHSSQWSAAWQSKGLYCHRVVAFSPRECATWNLSREHALLSRGMGGYAGITLFSFILFIYGADQPVACRLGELLGNKWISPFTSYGSFIVFGESFWSIQAFRCLGVPWSQGIGTGCLRVGRLRPRLLQVSESGR